LIGGGEGEGPFHDALVAGPEEGGSGYVAVGAPVEFTVGPGEPLVGYDAVDPEEDEEYEGGEGHGFAPCENFVLRATLLVPFDAPDGQHGDNNGCGKRDHVVGYSSQR